MRLLLTSTIAAVVIGGLVACSAVPTSDLRGYSSQPRVLSADHWRALAEQSAQEVAIVVANVNKARGGAIPVGVFVPEMPQDAAFYRSYSGELKQALLKQGLPVRTVAGNNLILNFKVETYLYSRRTGNRIPFTNNTMLAVLAAYVPEWVAESSWSDIRAGFISLVAIFDVLRAKSQVTDAEAVLVMTIEDGDSVLLLSSKPFYIEPRDFLLYWSDHPTAAVMGSGADRSQSLPVKTIRVVQ